MMAPMVNKQSKEKHANVFQENRTRVVVVVI